MTAPVPEMPSLKIVVTVDARGQLAVQGPPNVPPPMLVGILMFALHSILSEGSKPKSPLAI